MNTPAHLIFGTAASGEPGDRWITTAAVLGALAPDISLYAMVGWSINVRGVSPLTVFNEYYYSPEWRWVFAVDNSFVPWSVWPYLRCGHSARRFVGIASAGLQGKRDLVQLFGHAQG